MRPGVFGKMKKQQNCIGNNGYRKARERAREKTTLLEEGMTGKKRHQPPRNRPMEVARQAAQIKDERRATPLKEVRNTKEKGEVAAWGRVLGVRVAFQ